MKYILFVVAISTIFFACDSDRVYEQNHTIPNNQWYIDSIPSFTFTITDSTAAYNIYYNIRNANSYPYYNLYLTYYLLDEEGNQVSARLQELTLLDPKTGKPLGNGLGDIFDHQIVALPNFKFPKAGTYTIRLKQYMRQDPLPSIMSVGIRVEQAEGS
ncbi:gliding motility lipoprotein GldH [Rhodocytophaga aerolata]|uniref:Gliding motility lipoprotein GldH n=2 Tax=Rhodocytophaga aerolata TaxID=455078 RepID=A0ABT8QYE6_9BACT|nr:gliding motility lipoprotein GldH [Rhodocytophaga aerolata]MDO1444862.1 gliding motility lipoprotein GldH [Rhodocytophaga aerolata]